MGSHLLLLSGGGHHEDMAVSLQGIVAAVSGAAAMFLAEIATVM